MYNLPQIFAWFMHQAMAIPRELPEKPCPGVMDDLIGGNLNPGYLKTKCEIKLLGYSLYMQ